MSEPQEKLATILFVDDEINILASLKRLFRPLGYRIFGAESGVHGLEIMDRETVDLVVSDMRMPEMNGAQFLENLGALAGYDTHLADRFRLPTCFMRWPDKSVRRKGSEAFRCLNSSACC